MVFSSLEFIVFFFPIALLVNYLLPKKLQNCWLLAASLFFYAWGEPKFCFLLVLSIVFNYCAGLLLEKRHKKWIFAIILLLNLGTLFVYKYLNVTTVFLNTLNPGIKKTSIIIPLGISFYTFQAVSYIFDVYRGMKAEENFTHFALYITFFPQLLQGPIIRYREFSPYLAPRKFEVGRFSEGVIRFLTGLNEKVLVADILSELADAAFNNTGLSVCMAWLGMLAYALQIYFDFTGYSDMAIGLGKLFGFELAENFNYPYIAASVTDFWRRWHISLSSWFRDYLYFPLGGSRVKTKARVVLNLMIVWAATGIWHGAGLQFFVWGMLHGFFVTMEKMLGLPKWLKEHKVAGFLYRGVVLLVAMFGWVLFRVKDFPQAMGFYSSLFKLTGNAWRDSLFKFNSREYIVTLIFALLCCTPVFKKIRLNLSSRGEKAEAAVNFVTFLIQFIMAIFSISLLVVSTHDPFVYFNF